MTVQSAIQIFVNTISVESTKEAYERDLTRFSTWIGSETDVKSIEPLNIQNFVVTLSEHSVSYQNRIKGSIKRFFTFLFENQMIPSNPSSNLRLIHIRNDFNREIIQKNIIGRIDAYLRCGFSYYVIQLHKA